MISLQDEKRRAIPTNINLKIMGHSADFHKIDFHICADLSLR
jgi:hypothetical protein